MNIKYITDEQWEEFRTKYNSAYYFLMAENIKEEKKQLEIELNSRTILQMRKDWILKRIEHIRQCME